AGRKSPPLRSPYAVAAVVEGGPGPVAPRPASSTHVEVLVFTQHTHRGSLPLRLLLARGSSTGALALLLAVSSGCSQKSATAPGAAGSQSSRVAESFHRQRFQGQ